MGMAGMVYGMVWCMVVQYHTTMPRFFLENDGEST